MIKKEIIYAFYLYSFIVQLKKYTINVQALYFTSVLLVYLWNISAVYLSVSVQSTLFCSPTISHKVEILCMKWLLPWSTRRSRSTNLPIYCSHLQIRFLQLFSRSAFPSNDDTKPWAKKRRKKTIHSAPPLSISQLLINSSPRYYSFKLNIFHILPSIRIHLIRGAPDSHIRFATMAIISPRRRLELLG